MTARGVVINVHNHGATVRLDDGTLAAVPPGELAAHRPTYAASLQKRSVLDLTLERSGRHAVVFLAGTDDLPARGVGSIGAAGVSRRSDVAETDVGSPGPGTPVTGGVTRHGESATSVEDDLRDGEIVRTLRLVGDVPVLNDPLFEHRIAEYLKSTEEWAPADRPPPDERHLVRKKKRAAFFESRATKRQPPA